MKIISEHQKLCRCLQDTETEATNQIQSQIKHYNHFFARDIALSNTQIDKIQSIVNLPG